MRLVLPITALVLLLALVGCGGGGSNNNNGGGSLVPANVAINPTAATVAEGTTQAFTARVTGVLNTAVTWTVQEPNGGTVDANGLYTAPTTPGTYHVIATSQAQTTRSATATVTVIPPVSIAPTTATVVAGGVQTFTATVNGTPSNAVTWSVKEAGGGTISTSGVYTAPSTPGTYHVVAAITADPTKTATATVTVIANPLVINPKTPQVSVGGTVNFTATFNGVATTAINWSVLEGTPGGTINANGVYTAPAIAGTYHVVATSQADNTKQVTATVTVLAGGVQVGVQ